MELSPYGHKADEEQARRLKRSNLKELNVKQAGEQPSKALDSSLKRHTALIKRIRQSLGTDNRDQVIKDIDTLSLEKYVDEIAGAIMEGIVRCKTEKDVWSAVEIISLLHRRFPKAFTPVLLPLLSAALAAPPRAALSAMTPEQREKEDGARVARQRPVLRVCAELALVGIIKDSPERSGGEWIMKAIRDLLSNDPSLSSLPLLSTFLKSFSRPYLGILAPATAKQISSSAEPGTLSSATTNEANEAANDAFPPLVKEEDELVEKDIRDRFRKMCEGYFENVAKKLVIEHNRLQEQDRRNHEAYIRSGEIFEDRQQAYEKMTKGYEKLLASCQSLSELLYMPMPTLKTSSQKSESILIGTSAGSSVLGGDADEMTGGKWEDEEERRFFEDTPDLKDYVPRSVLGMGEDEDRAEEGKEERETREKERVLEEMRRLDEELAGLDGNAGSPVNGYAKPAGEGADEGGGLKDGQEVSGKDEDDDDNAPTPTPGSPKTSPSTTPQLAPQGPSQLLTALLTRLPDATNRTLIDQAAVDFAFLNSKASRKRLVKFMSQTPKSRTDLLPHYSRLIAILNRYMPDIGTELVAILDEEFRYLQRKKKVVNELAEVRLKNITFLSNLTKFRVIPPHLILHMFKVCLDDFSGTNVDNVALLLEGCGRFLLRSDETKEPFSRMVELMRRKQSLQHFDQRQLLLLENAYYQCNPPERTARQAKERTPMEHFIRHLIYDVLAKKTIDKVLKLLRKLDWNDDTVLHTLHKLFTKPWKVKYGNIPLLAMLTYDLQRYHPSFTIAVVDQVLEDIRRGLEQNVYSINQQRIASVKYLGELYIFRLISSGIIFDTLWTLVTFGHPEGRPLPNQPCPIDMPDDFFRIRLVCVILDTCGMCFDRGTQLKKLDQFLAFFQFYALCKIRPPMEIEFMLTDSIEAVRPKLTMFKTFEEAAVAVDEMFNSAFQDAGVTTTEDSGEESGDEEEARRDEDEDEEEEQTTPQSPVDDRAPSPEAVLLKSSQENLGPSEQDDAEFAKELAKLVTDTSAESRKVDKKTALALWESTVPPPVLRKKRHDDIAEDGITSAANGAEQQSVMNFTLFTKRGNKQQTRQIAIPAESALAVQTRTAQLQDKVEQQHLKRLVLDYEQREEAEELKALEARNRAGAIKIRYVG
ncbi:transcription factor [Sparassis latifolia]